MAVLGGNVLLLCGSVLGMVMGASVGMRVRAGLAVVACLSLSSAPLARRLLDSEPNIPVMYICTCINLIMVLYE